MTNKELREKVYSLIHSYGLSDGVEEQIVTDEFLSLVAEALPKCIKADPMIDSWTTKRMAWLNCGRKEYQREVQKLLKGE